MVVFVPYYLEYLIVQKPPFSANFQRGTPLLFLQNLPFFQQVYREPRPQTIKKVMRRVREASLNTTEKTLTKLVHQSPARMHEIYKRKGGRIPARWNYKKSPFACTCKICKE